MKYLAYAICAIIIVAICSQGKFIFTNYYKFYIKKYGKDYVEKKIAESVPLALLIATFFISIDIFKKHNTDFQIYTYVFLILIMTLSAFLLNQKKLYEFVLESELILIKDYNFKEKLISKNDYFIDKESVSTDKFLIKEEFISINDIELNQEVIQPKILNKSKKNLRQISKFNYKIDFSPNDIINLYKNLDYQNLIENKFSDNYCLNNNADFLEIFNSNKIPNEPQFILNFNNIEMNLFWKGMKRKINDLTLPKFLMIFENKNKSKSDSIYTALSQVDAHHLKKYHMEIKKLFQID